MRIWYDISALVDGVVLPNAVVEGPVFGLQSGLASCGVDVRLVRFDQTTGNFRRATWRDVPQPVRVRLGLEAAAQQEALHHSADSSGDGLVDAPDGHAPAGRRKRRSIARRVFGKGVEGEELRVAFQDLKNAANHFSSCALIWARRRWRHHDSDGLPTPPSWMVEQVTTRPAMWLDSADPQTGDVLVAAGTGWAHKGQVEAVATARDQGVMIVQTIDGIGPAFQPQWCDGSSTQAFVRWLRVALTHSDRVLTFSESTRREVERYCGESRLQMPSCIVVRGCGSVDEIAADGDALPRPVFVPSRPFFLCASPLTAGDNHHFLHGVWIVLKATLRGDCPDLLCIGTPDPTRAALVHAMHADRSVNRHVHEVPTAARWEQRWYYANCEAVICPSRHDDGVLPVAKALAAGRLCLAARSSSAVEAGGDLPDFFEPFDARGLANLLVRVLRDRGWVRAREQEIRRAFRTTTWHDIAEQTIAVLERTTGHQVESGSATPFFSARGSALGQPVVRGSRAA